MEHIYAQRLSLRVMLPTETSTCFTAISWSSGNPLSKLLWDERNSSRHSRRTTRLLCLQPQRPRTLLCTLCTLPQVFSSSLSTMRKSVTSSSISGCLLYASFICWQKQQQWVIDFPRLWNEPVAKCFSWDGCREEAERIKALVANGVCGQKRRFNMSCMPRRIFSSLSDHGNWIQTFCSLSGCKSMAWNSLLQRETTQGCEDFFSCSFCSNSCIGKPHRTDWSQQL